MGNEQPITDSFEESSSTSEAPQQQELPLEGGGASAGGQPADGKPAEPAPRRKVKLGDQELDLDDEEFKKLRSVEMVRGAQQALRQAADARKQAQQLRAQAQQVIQALKERPESALHTAGMTQREQVQWAERLLAEEMLRQGVNPETGERLTAEQMQLIRLQQERDEASRKASEYEKRQMAERREQAKAQVRAQLDRELTSALREGGLPPTDNMIGRLAQAYADLDFEVPAKDLVPLVMDDFRQELGAMMKGLSPNDILQLLPKEALEAIRKADLAAAKAGPDRLASRVRPGVLPENREGGKNWQDRRRARITDPKEAQRALDDWAGR